MAHMYLVPDGCAPKPGTHLCGVSRAAYCRRAHKHFAALRVKAMAGQGLGVGRWAWNLIGEKTRQLDRSLVEAVGMSASMTKEPTVGRVEQ